MLAPATRPEEGTVSEAAKKNRKHFENEDLDEEMVGSSWQWRALVSYLPWLQATVQWWRIQREPITPTDQAAHPIAGGNLGKLESAESDTERGESSNDDRRKTWGTENTLHMNPTDAEENSVQSSPKKT